MIAFLYRAWSLYEEKWMEATDNRLQVIKNVFDNIRFIKQNAMENIYAKIVSDQRSKESGFMLINCLIGITMDLLTSVLDPASVVVFMLFYFKSGEELDIANATILLRICYILHDAFHWVPACITDFADLKIGIKRLSKFLRSEEIDLKNFETPDESSPYAIEI